VGRLAPRASVTFGCIPAISAGDGPLNNCQKAMISLEKDCSYENSISHSLTAPPTCRFQNSILPYSPRFTQTQPTYRSQRISTDNIYGACTTPHTPLTPPFAHPPPPQPTNLVLSQRHPSPAHVSVPAYLTPPYLRRLHHPTHPTHPTQPTTTPHQPTAPLPSGTPCTPPHVHPTSPHAPHAPQ